MVLGSLHTFLTLESKSTCGMCEEMDMPTNGHIQEDTKPLDISSVSLTHLENLEHLLGQRSPRSSLTERNIMKDANVAPSLQAASDTLRKKKLQENLEHKLEQRRSREDLVLTNVMKTEGAVVAPSLQNAQQQLKFHRTQIELGQKLDNRPEKSALIESNIIKDSAPTIQGAKQALQFKRTSITLENKLGHRPTISDLLELNIIQEKLDLQASLSAEHEVEGEADTQ